MRRGFALLFLMLSCVPTSFYGSPKVANGAAGCKAICASYGMQLAGMVALGEYSDGCICEVAGARSAAAAGSAGAAAAVMTAMQAAADAAAARNAKPPLQPPPF
jgi:hypothetical protein